VVAVICVATIVLLDLASRCRVRGALAGARSGKAIDTSSTPALSPLYAPRSLETLDTASYAGSKVPDRWLDQEEDAAFATAVGADEGPDTEPRSGQHTAKRPEPSVDRAENGDFWFRIPDFH
jgi:hypothetical protein